MRTLALTIIYTGSVFYSVLNPLYGLLFFVHITILRPEALVWGHTVFGRLHFITAASVAIGLLCGARGYFGRDIKDAFQRVNVFVFAAFLASLLAGAMMANASVQMSMDKSIEVAKIFVLCVLFWKIIKTEAELRAYVWVVAVSFGALSLWGALQGMAGNPRLDTLWPGGSNYIGAMLALVAPLVFAMTRDRDLSGRQRVALYVCFASIVLCCVYTESRGAFLGLSTGMLIVTLGTKQRLRTIATGLFLILLMFPWIPVSYQERVTSIFAEAESRDESSMSRTVLWGIALRIWQDHPIMGVGLENFSAVKEGYADKVHDMVTSDEMAKLIFGRQRYPHGMYTGLLAETGLVGTGLLLLLILRNIFCRTPRSLSNALYLQMKGAKAGLIGFAVAAVFGDFQYIEMLYVQLFFVGAVRALGDRAVKRVPDAAASRETGLALIEGTGIARSGGL